MALGLPIQGWDLSCQKRVRVDAVPPRLLSFKVAGASLSVAPAIRILIVLGARVWHSEAARPTRPKTSTGQGSTIQYARPRARGHET